MDPIRDIRGSPIPPEEVGRSLATLQLPGDLQLVVRSLVPVLEGIREHGEQHHYDRLRKEPRGWAFASKFAHHLQAPETAGVRRRLAEVRATGEIREQEHLAGWLLLSRRIENGTETVFTLRCPLNVKVELNASTGEFSVFRPPGRSGLRGDPAFTGTVLI